jgi:signal transduction histidine kinase
MTPFFTTKQAEQGTGIGLSLSRTIARRHGGDLTLDQDAKNTTFVLTVPKEAEVS